MDLLRKMALKSCKSQVDREVLKALWRLVDAFEGIAEYLKKDKP